MFATITGPWPRARLDGTPTDGDPAAVDALVAELIALQVEAGIGLVADGQVRWPELSGAVVDEAGYRSGGLVDAWRATSALTELPVKQAVPGPYSLARRLVEAASHEIDRAGLTLALAEGLGDELRGLAAAGCPLVEVEEPALVNVGADEAERALFVEAQRRLLAPAPALHATLAVTGGNADAAGAATVFGAPYRSYLFDLIAGPDNWRLVREAPLDAGIVCGALRVESAEDQAPVLVWAARYAASSGRGMDRVGLANAGSLAGLSPADAAARVRALGRAAAYAAMPIEAAVAAGLDPRAMDSRTAALGGVPRPARRARRPPA